MRTTIYFACTVLTLFFCSTIIANHSIEESTILSSENQNCDSLAQISMELITDDYGEETTWELTNINNAVLFSGGPYPNNTTFNEEWCLPNGCYTWTIYDSYGDGICCYFGEGSYTINNDTDTTLIATGGAFTNVERVEFCITGSVCLEADDDDDGLCGEVDCDNNDPAIGGAGTPCDDGNSNTIQDAYDSNCNCTGKQVIPCVDGNSGGFPCNNVDLVSYMSLIDMGCVEANDIWGWTDPQTGKEYAVFGCNDRTTFIDISTPVAPVLIGSLLTHTTPSLWRDMKVHADHAFIVSEAGGHGMQVFDLNQLRDVTNPPVIFDATAHLDDLGNGVSLSNSHNIVVNEGSGFAYTVGSNTCSGGLTSIDISDPANPVFTGCFAQDGYTHDAQCVNYIGPDSDYAGIEICFNSNENTLTIVDVSDKTDMTLISRTGYPQEGYSHQGWLTDNQEYFLMNDELDEVFLGNNTRTHIWDVRDLDTPVYMGFYEASVISIDHNLYIQGDLAYLTNYRSGLRILDISDIENANLEEVAYFDTYPANDSPQFNATWSNYPYFESGNIIVSDIEQGLFILKYNPAEPVLTANFTVSPSAICAGESVTITNSSTNADSYNWSAPGATPEMSTDENPTFNFPDAGTYTIILTASNATDNSTTQREVVVYDLPVVAEITGEEFPVNGSVETYTTPFNQGSTYNWFISGGTQISGGNTNTIEVMWQDPNNMAYLCVTEIDANGCRSVQELCYDVLTVVSVEDIALEKGLKIFPNPTNGMLYIESNQVPDNGEVFDVIGQRLAIDYQNNTLDMSQQASGVYFVRITYEEGSVTRRVMVN